MVEESSKEDFTYELTCIRDTLIQNKDILTLKKSLKSTIEVS